MSKLIKDLGAVSAYAYAVEKGYTGTEDEFAELMYDYTDVAQTAVEAKDEAVSASASAQASATTANTKAAEASASASNAQSASNSAQGAETNAENFALNADTKATEAKQFADKAELNAQKTQSDKEAVESAKSDVLSAVDNAQNYANSAQSASQAIQNMDVEATTLEPDSDATVEKTVDSETGTVTLTYGIPKGIKGEKGDKGDTGDSGVYIGASAPSDENVNVWIDSDGEPDDVIQIDDTLTQSGQAADAKVVGDEISDVKEGLSESVDGLKYTLSGLVSQSTPITLSDGAIYTGYTIGNTVNTRVVATAGYRCALVDCASGDSFVINTSGGSSPRAYAFIDSNNALLEVAPFGESFSGTVTAPTNTAKLIINDKSGSGTAYAVSAPGRVDVLEDKVEILEDAIPTVNALKSVSPDTYPGYYNSSGGIISQDPSMLEVYTYKFEAKLFLKFKIHLTFTQSTPVWVAYCTWLSDGTFSRTVLESGNHSFFDYVSPEITLDSMVKYVAFTFRTVNLNTYYIESSAQYGNILFEAYNDAETANDANMGNIERSVIGINPLRFKPLYDHLFITQVGNVFTIPQQSIYHVRLSKRMGFDVIETNIATTSDGVYFTGHLGSGGTFGRWFEHVDGVTDISNTVVSSVTWDWISENVRYKSAIAKYRTRPCTLQEFFKECLSQNIIPFVYIADTNVAEIAESYFGVGNYIAYGASRAIVPNGIIYQWLSEKTKDGILQRCRSYGKPFIYGMANPSIFTNSELEEIVEAVHAEGYLIASAYVDASWNNLRKIGFDVLGSMQSINRIESGNLYNISSVFGFSDFTYTNATETNGTLVFSGNGTVSPKVTPTTYDVCGVDIEITFTGEITLPTKGEHNYTETHTADGIDSVFMAVPIINGTPEISVNVSSGSVIYDIVYKASKF